MKDEQKELLRRTADTWKSACESMRESQREFYEKNPDEIPEQGEDWADELPEAVAAIEAALKEVERGRWIPLSERKPEENQYVLLWSPGPWLRLAYWSSFAGSEATHWMLPQEDPQ